MGEKKDKKQAPADSKPTIKEEVPPPPVVNSSVYSTVNTNMLFNEFNKYPADFYESLKTQTFETAAPFHGRPLKDSFEEILNEFNAASPQDLIINPSQAIIDFADYLKQNINPEVFKFIANYWPASIPANGCDVYTLFLVKMLHQAKQPQGLLQWIAQKIFPINFTKPNPNPHLAICRCKKGKKPGFWAVLDANKIFYIYNFKGNEQQEQFNVKPTAFQIGKDKISVEVMDNKGKALWKFVPEDPAQVQLWANVLENPAPMLQFMTSISTPAPDQLYQAAYQVIMNTDAHILRTLLNPTLSQPDSAVAKTVIESFFHVYSYGGKANVLIEQVLLYDLSHLQVTVNEFIAKPSHSKNLLNAIVNLFIAPYTQAFMTKLTTYIDEQGIFGLGTPEVDVQGVEKLVANICKFIAHSYYLVPDTIKQAFNIARTYLSITANNTLTIYQFIAEIFLKTYIYNSLINVKKINPNVQHPEYFLPIARLLYVVFSLGNIDGEFEGLADIEKRLQKKVYPMLVEFIVTVSDFPLQEAEFPVPKADPLARAIEAIHKAIDAIPQKFSLVYADVEAVDRGQSLLGTNFASMLTQCFIHAFDATPVAQEQPQEVKTTHHKLIKADQFNEEELKDKKIRKVVKYDKNEPRAQSPEKPKKYYKKVTKKVPRDQN